MEIGGKIKERRTLLMLTQQELADRCELTKGYISQLENDKVSPSIETLENILEVLGISFQDFFTDSKDPQIIYNADEQYVKEFDGYIQTWLVPTSQQHQLEPILVEIEPESETFHDYPHDGEEFGYVIEGEIVVVYGNTNKVCKKNESFYFVTDKEHYIKNKSKRKAKIVWVSCPPNF